MIALVRPYKKTYMNNIDVLILALLTFNCIQVCNFSSASIKSTYYELNFWGMIATAYLPLLVVSYNILPSKRLFNLMKQKVATCKKFCCTKNEEINMGVEVSDNDGHDPQGYRMVHPDQFSAGVTNEFQSSEGDALLREPGHVRTPVYLSIN